MPLNVNLLTPNAVKPARKTDPVTSDLEVASHHKCRPRQRSQLVDCLEQVYEAENQKSDSSTHGHYILMLAEESRTAGDVITYQLSGSRAQQ